MKINTLIYIYMNMTEIEEKIAAIPNIVRTLYKNRFGIVTQSIVHLKVNSSREEVEVYYATKHDDYILVLVKGRTFLEAVMNVAEKVKELGLSETETLFDERRSKNERE